MTEEQVGALRPPGSSVYDSRDLLGIIFPESRIRQPGLGSALKLAHYPGLRLLRSLQVYRTNSPTITPRTAPLTGARKAVPADGLWIPRRMISPPTSSRLSSCGVVLPRADGGVGTS